MASEPQQPEPSPKLLLLSQPFSSSSTAFSSSSSSPNGQTKPMSPHAFVITRTECGEALPQSPQRQHLSHHHHHHYHHHHHHHQLYAEIQRERRCQEQPPISLPQESSLPSTLSREARSTSPAPAPLMVVVVLVILTVVFQLPVCQGIRIVDVDVPAQAVEGDTVKLGCRFNKEGDSLYTLTWWWKDNQFFKYNPHGPMKMTIHKLSGIIVDRAKSGLTTVVLQNVTRSTSGTFKCEVVADRPSFEKDSKNKTMDVVDLPDRTPVVEVEQAHYSPGDILVANCTSLRSRPAASLGWSVNGLKVDDGSHRIISKGNTTMGLFSPTSQLRLPLRRYHFNDGDVEVTCAASIGSVYDQRSDVSIRLAGPRAAAPTQKLYGTGTTTSNNVPLYVAMALLLTGLSHF
ncbi:uncharacterized protein LOC143037220 [Oratosquilla oratoria]|uniref:uncharacterized protein LOC143037220 n=1 Tax=Oratosquilla oratoria TaxID=337810 RepID=UPI003F76010B